MYFLFFWGWRGGLWVGPGGLPEAWQRVVGREGCGTAWRPHKKMRGGESQGEGGRGARSTVREQREERLSLGGREGSALPRPQTSPAQTGWLHLQALRTLRSLENGTGMSPGRAGPCWSAAQTRLGGSPSQAGVGREWTEAWAGRTRHQPLGVRGLALS